MADGRILRFRRRESDGSTRALLTPGQAESISEALLADGLRARARKAARANPLHNARCLAGLAPARRAAIIAAARRNVNNRWTTALVIGVPVALYAAAMWLWDSTIPDSASFALLGLLFAPAIAIHAAMVRREIEALVQQKAARRQRAV